MRKKVFSGRVIFHHIAKTAGMAINAWLRERLGAGCVTENLLGEHRRLIAYYGGQYSIIFAHLGFSGEGLDPRYRYVTLLRDPVERVISWLFFALNHHTRERLIQDWGWDAWSAVKQLIDSEGERLDERLLPIISNEMVRNFASILDPSPASDAKMLDLALSAIQQYELVGIYEELSAFLRRLAAMLGLPYEGLKPVNVTREKPSHVSPKLREKLHALNLLDLEFYRQVRVLAHKQPEPTPSELGWQPWSGFGERSLQASCLTQVEAGLVDGESVRRGELLRFFFKFTLTEPVEELEPGIHIFDQDQRWAFGTNTTLLGQPLRQLAPGNYQVRWNLIADLPAGKYTAGFALANPRGGSQRELFWRDRMISFEVQIARHTPSVGYADLPVTVTFSRR